MGQRIFFGALLIIMLVGLIAADMWLSAYALADMGTSFGPVSSPRHWLIGLPFAVIAVTLVVAATFELGALCRAGGYRPVTAWAAFVGAGLVLLPWMQMQERLAPEHATWLKLGIPLELLWLMGGFIGTAIIVLGRRVTERATSSLAIALLMMVYIGLLGSFMLRVRCLDPAPAGAVLLAYTILTIKSSDIGAYFTGRAFGRRKLVPWLSPGKTVEGAVGAVVFAAGVGVLGMWLWGRFGTNLGDPPLNYPQAFVFGALMAITGHFGDLVESVIKRDVGSKDSGVVVPAFGGLLDVLDSLLIASPFAWLMLTIVAGMR